jgi:creatinine amidohydrolase/Fe(II)-dependent formamide hydrolase-like protein
MVSNFHGGPRHFLAIEKACVRANRRYGLRMAPIFSLLISRLTAGTANLDEALAEIPGVDAADLVGDTHGGLVETSLLLALHGDWVDPEYRLLPRQTVETWRANRGEIAPQRASSGDPRRFLDMLRSFEAGFRFFTENSYSGAPSGATPEIGEAILDTLGREAGTAIGELLDGVIDPDDCHSPLWKLRFLFLNPLMIRLSNRLLGFRNPIA